MKRTQPIWEKPPESDYWYLYAQQPYISASHNLREGDPDTHMPLNKHERFKCELYINGDTQKLDPDASSRLAAYKLNCDKFNEVPEKKREHYEIF